MIHRSKHVTGEFFASKPKKMTGELAIVDMPHFRYEEGQQALWNTTVKVSGGVDYPSMVVSE